MPQLTAITTITATLELVTGLRIGAGDSEMHIGGVDNTVIKHPHTQSPYIPGSSLKGKMRSLLEWRSGAVKEEALGWKDYEKSSGATQAEVKCILQLFGISGGDKVGVEEMGKIGPTRISFWTATSTKSGQTISAKPIFRSPKSKAKTASTASLAWPSTRAKPSAYRPVPNLTFACRSGNSRVMATN